ncbi:hypothetical protein [Corallincola spongiicola]|uniref:Uncharacterized protein n=1 Tax=Corallincola spongiicola TaxID=2520508 RepID=A0ABY1WTM9_9GAMM|nr:hypothetical protein [Corallincola spongiicola]TAA48095.1 hypothetical protein EXY25_02310 [Corallincola spongiicola]
MALKFSDSKFFLGDTAFEDQLIFPADELPAVDYLAYKAHQLRARFSHSYQFQEGLTKFDRLQAYLLSKRDLLREQVSSDLPVIFLMPQLSPSADEAGKLAFDLVTTLFPELATSANCYLYPYGRASALMGMKRLDTLLEQSQVTHVTIVAADCSALSLTNEYVANDCILLTRVAKSDVGVLIPWLKTEAQLTTTEVGGAVSAIFSGYVTEIGSPVDQYCVTHAAEEQRDEWLCSYQKLAKVLSPRTKTSFSNLFLGELGAASGLFEVLNYYRQGVAQTSCDVGNRLQLDISEYAYRSAALLTWQG